MWAILIIYPPDIFPGWDKLDGIAFLCDMFVAKDFSKKNRYIFCEETIAD